MFILPELAINKEQNSEALTAYEMGQGLVGEIEQYFSFNKRIPFVMSKSFIMAIF